MENNITTDYKEAVELQSHSSEALSIQIENLRYRYVVEAKEGQSYTDWLEEQLAPLPPICEY